MCGGHARRACSRRAAHQFPLPRRASRKWNCESVGPLLGVVQSAPDLRRQDEAEDESMDTSHMMIRPKREFEATTYTLEDQATAHAPPMHGASLIMTVALDRTTQSADVCLFRSPAPLPTPGSRPNL